VEYWKEKIGLPNVLAKHPYLTVVSARTSWLICQDAQNDFLRFLLANFQD